MGDTPRRAADDAQQVTPLPTQESDLLITRGGHDKTTTSIHLEPGSGSSVLIADSDPAASLSRAVSKIRDKYDVILVDTTSPAESESGRQSERNR